MEEHLVKILKGCIKQDRKNGAISILNDSFMKVFSRIKKYDQTKSCQEEK